MSANKFTVLCRSQKMPKNDAQWFPRWLFRYASSQQKSRVQPLVVTLPVVIRFLRSLRDNGVPAWQRLQATKAIELYRSKILGTEEPLLVEIVRTLQ